MSKLQVRLFGAFRNLYPDPEIEIDFVSESMTVADLRLQLEISFRQDSSGQFDAVRLVKKSAIADERKILLEETVLKPGQRLALLPPVSGG